MWFSCWVFLEYELTREWQLRSMYSELQSVFILCTLGTTNHYFAQGQRGAGILSQWGFFTR